jgi:F-type H+-transporting ATPase subunit epsilon
MANNQTFHLSVITPERAVLETAATFVAFPAYDGEVGVLHDRAPLLYKLGIGELRAETPTAKHRLFIDGGFAQMVANRLTILTEQAKPAEEIDKPAVARALAAAEALPIPDEAAYADRQRALQRARVQLRMAG